MKKLKRKKCIFCKEWFEYLSCIKKRKYCSMECKDKHQKNGKYEKCLICKKDMYVQKSQLRKFCSHTCHVIFQKNNATGERVRIPKVLRFLLLKKFNYCCFYCSKSHQILLPLQIHHIDWNPRNTVEENLIPLCISCHRRLQKKYLQSKRLITDLDIKNKLKEFKQKAITKLQEIS